MLPSPKGIKRSEEHTSELQSRLHLVCRLLLEKRPTSSHLYTLSLHDALPILSSSAMLSARFDRLMFSASAYIRIRLPVRFAAATAASISDRTLGVRARIPSQHAPVA